MKLLDHVNEEIAVAMRAKDQTRLGTLRMLKTALVNRRVERGRELDEPEAQQIVSMLIKQRREAIDQFARGGRQDLVDKETAEIAILEGYLPPAVDAEELDRTIEAAILEASASSSKDLGRVMKAAMAKLAGRNVDGKAVNELVRRKLALRQAQGEGG